MDTITLHNGTYIEGEIINVADNFKKNRYRRDIKRVIMTEQGERTKIETYYYCKEGNPKPKHIKSIGYTDDDAIRKVYDERN